MESDKGKRERGLDIGLKTGRSRSLFASPGSYRFSYSRELWHSSAKWINTPPMPFRYCVVAGHRGWCLTKETCLSSLAREGIGWEVNPSQVHKSLRS